MADSFSRSFSRSIYIDQNIPRFHINYLKIFFEVYRPGLNMSKTNRLPFCNHFSGVEYYFSKEILQGIEKIGSLQIVKHTNCLSLIWQVNLF